MASLITVTCPHCHHEQSEPAEVISTVCERCNGYIAIHTDRPLARPATPKRSRLITCPHCETAQKVYPLALTTICTGCGEHLNIANHTVSGKARSSLSTFGDVVFTPGCQYAGAEVKAQFIQVSGSLRTRLRAFRRLEFHGRASVTGSIFANEVSVEPLARATIRRLVAERLVVQGHLQAESLLVHRSIEIMAGGSLLATTVRAPELRVSSGAYCDAEFETIPLAGVELERERRD